MTTRTGLFLVVVLIGVNLVTAWKLLDKRSAYTSLQTNYGKCEDTSRYCKFFESKYRTAKNPNFCVDFGHSMCMKFCKICESCVDNASGYYCWKERRNLRCNLSFIKRKCKKTCGEC